MKLDTREVLGSLMDETEDKIINKKNGGFKMADRNAKSDKFG